MNTKFNIIYMDPPWEFKVRSDKGKGRSAEQHYSVMTIDRLKLLPLKDIAETECVLLMWVTYPMLNYGLDLIKFWGFEYKTCGFTWVKLNKKGVGYFIGMGYHTRGNAEICLLATIGKKALIRHSKSVRNLVVAPRRRHSEKPKEVADRIVQLYGDIPRIELFARSKYRYEDGWIKAGYDIDGRDIFDAIELIKTGTYLDDIK